MNWEPSIDDKAKPKLKQYRRRDGFTREPIGERTLGPLVRPDKPPRPPEGKGREIEEGTVSGGR